LFLIAQPSHERSSSEQIIDARTSLGLYLNQLTCHVEAKESIDPILDLAIRHGYKKRLCQVYTIIGSYYCYVEEDFPKALESLKQALEISGEVGDQVSLAFASLWLGVALSWECDFEKARHYFQRTLDINAAAKNLWGVAMIKSNLTYFCYYYPGRISQTIKSSAEAL
jgi:tetratricopeptide (TPR) repeat protein